MTSSQIGRAALSVIAALFVGAQLPRLGDVPPAAYLVAGPVALLFAIFAKRGGRWLVIAVVACTVLGLYQFSLQVGPIDVRASDPALIALITSAVFFNRRSDRPSDVGQWYLALFLAVIGLTIVAALLAGKPGIVTSLVAWGRLVATLSPVWLVPRVIESEVDRRFIFGWVLAFCAAATVVVLVQTAASGGPYDRISGLLDPNVVGLLSAILVVATVNSKLPNSPWARIAFFLIGCLGLVGSRSIASIAAVAITLGIRRLRASRRSPPNDPLLTPLRLALLCLAAVGVVGGLRGANLPGSESFATSSTAHRLVMGTAGIDLFLDHPILGVGWQRSSRSDEIGDAELSDRLRQRYPSASAEFFPDTNDWTVHNAYLQVLAESGLVGALALATAIIAMRRRIWRLIRRVETQAASPLASVLLLLLVVVLIWWNDNPLFGAVPETVLASTFIGLLASHSPGDGTESGKRSASQVHNLAR
jgi:O-antigen ligase